MIGLCLKYEQTNYGSKLQALATIKVFEKLGLNYMIIRYEKAGLLFKLKALTRIFNSTFRQDKIEDFSRNRAIKKHPEISSLLLSRKKMFIDFDREYFEKHVITGRYYKDIKELAKQFDSIVSCSDQLWSPSGLGTNFYNLMFVPDGINKVSFASSFGVSKIPWYQKSATARYLRRINYISCRENRGADIVKELTGKKVPVIMDPVFAFSRAEWESIVPKEIIYNIPYIFCFLLGDNPTHREATVLFAKKVGLKVVCLKHLDQYVKSDEKFGDICPYDITPFQFLNILRGATYVVTDSFHGCAFSIIMQKEFAVFNRYSSDSSSSKNSRIDSVCLNLGLQNRRADNYPTLSDLFKSPIEWKRVEYKQDVYRKKIWRYLHVSLIK